MEQDGTIMFKSNFKELHYKTKKWVEMAQEGVQ